MREVGFSAFFIFFVVLMGVWFASRKDAYDPRERDISIEMMVADSVSDNLYRTPFEQWTDPAATVVTGEAPAPQVGVFPPTILDGGWKTTARVKVYDEVNLFEKINGGAPQYFQFGFVAMHYVPLSNAEGNLDLSIEMYDMGEFRYAMGIYAAQRDAEKKLERLKDAYFHKTDVGAIGVTGHYYFKIYGSEENPAVQEKSMQVTTALAESELGTTEYPPVYRVFADDLSIPFERIAYEKEDVFQYDFAKDFWFARPDAESDVRYFVHQAETDEAAGAMMQQLIDSNLEEYEKVSEERGVTVLKHQFLDEFFAISREGAVVYGMDAIPEGYDYMDAMGTLITAIYGAMSNEKA